MLNWIRKRLVHEGKVIVTWPAKDLREDRLIVDISRLDDNLVGIRRRRYGVLRRTEAIPEYRDTVEFIPVDRLWKTEYKRNTEQDTSAPDGTD